MPLPPSNHEREPIHTRRVTCQGYRRADGLWDIEGHLRDTKSYGFDNHERGMINPGDPIHDMWLRLTLDDTMTVKDAVAITEASPYGLCPSITPRYGSLIGLRIGPGWTRKTRQLFGGINGCTHLTELLGPIATTAFQTIYPYLARQQQKPREGAAQPENRETSETGEAKGESQSGPKQKPPVLLNTCHAFAAHSPVVKRQWPAFYQEQAPGSAASSDDAIRQD
ncbi:MAG: DUF2889 domain-containing protein [Pseudomonadota bacterium]